MTSPSKAPQPEVVVHIDGASRGNPGPAAYAVVMESSGGSALAAFSKYLGEATNNYAEYQALLAALEYALECQHRRIRVLTDSELLARQIRGQYKVKHAALKPLHEQARRLIARLEAFSIEHVPREQNREADRLANQALDAAARGAGLPVRLRSSLDFRSGLGAKSNGRPRAKVEGKPALTLLRASATYQKGILKPHEALPLMEGEEVEIEIRRRK
jgi:probable phosphoglycerate mutase